MDIYEILERNAKEFNKKAALIYRDKSLSFKELRDKSVDLALGLKKLGVDKGDKIAVYLPTSIDYCLSYLATFLLGAVVVPLDLMLKEDELIACLNHSETKVLLTFEKNQINFSQIKESVKSLENIVQDTASLMGNDINNFEKTEIKDGDDAAIFYTSGSTGRPKGVLHTYKHLSAVPEAMEFFVDLSDKDTKLCALPLSHGGGFVYLQNCIYFGITLVLMDRFNPIEFLKNIEKYKVTCFHIVPAMYVAIVALKEFDKYDLSSIRWVNVFGAPNNPQIIRRFHQVCPHAHLLNGWGLTETNAPNTVIPMGSNRIESIGRPAPWIEIKIIDDDNNALPQGEVGELIMKSWVVMKGYYKDPELTSEVIHNGWFYTGDLAKQDNEGLYYIVGRKKEVIKVGGQLVYAPEVEEVIHKHPQVHEVGVVGVADKIRGEVVKAFVSLKEGAKVSAEDIRHFAKQHLAHFKVPARVELIKELPKTRTGKIDKKALKQQ